MKKPALIDFLNSGSQESICPFETLFSSF